jgi:hypothetical protein
VSSALPRLIRGRSGRLGVDAVMVYAGLLGSLKEVCPLLLNRGVW